MAEIPYEYEIDEKNGVVDGRDFALKCMMHAYELLGAYAGGDDSTYYKLIFATERMAHTELAMRRDSEKDGEIPVLSIVVDEEDPAKAATRFEQHLADTADRTRNLVETAENMGA